MIHVIYLFFTCLIDRQPRNISLTTYSPSLTCASRNILNVRISFWGLICETRAPESSHKDVFFCQINGNFHVPCEVLVSDSEITSHETFLNNPVWRPRLKRRECSPIMQNIFVAEVWIIIWTCVLDVWYIAHINFSDFSHQNVKQQLFPM